jgi:photosystem II stability/assembly factor-like uncharacterized protein
MSFLPYLSTTEWLPIGPAAVKTPKVSLGFSAGRVEAAAPHPANSDIMYIGGADGGVWKTTNWNNSGAPPVWIGLSNDHPSLNFSGYHPLVVHPANHNLVLGVVSGPGAGILKSANAGLSWQVLANGQFEGASFAALAVHSNNTQILYVALWKGGPGGGIYKSVDGGLNWSANLTPFHKGSVSDLIVSKFNPEVLYAGLVPMSDSDILDTSGVYRSVDSGANWNVMSGSGLPSGPFLGRGVRLESAMRKSPVIYAALYKSDIDEGLMVSRFRTTDGGDTWSELAPTPGTPEFRAWHLLIGANPEDPQHVVANDEYALYESLDAGKTWTHADKGIGDDWVNIAFDANNNIVATADRNVYRYAHKTKEWLAREGNLQITQFFDITLDPQNPDLIYGVSQDHPHAMKGDGNLEWAYMGDGGNEYGKVLVDAGNSDLLYVSDPVEVFTKLVRRSTDGGKTWKFLLSLGSPFPAGEEPDLLRVAKIVQKAFVMDPSQSSRLLIGITSIHETKNADGSAPAWVLISPESLSPSKSLSDQYITTLAIASSDGNTIYAATRDGHVWLTQKGGGQKNWKEHDNGLFGSNAGYIVGLRIDPTDPRHAFAVTTGEGGNNVWRLKALGKGYNWLNVSGDLPANLLAASIFVDWQYSIPPLYVGTEWGVYCSVDLGSHWTRFGMYLPYTLVTDLQFQAKHQILAAGTFGAGVWEILIKPSEVRGVIFDDLDGDGIQDANEKGMAGVTVFLDSDRDGKLGPADFRTSTDASGNYVFPKVPPGTYSLCQIPPAGYVQTTPKFEPITVNGSELRGKKFGNHRVSTRARRAKSYLSVADLVALPGRLPDERVGLPDEFDRLPTRKVRALHTPPKPRKRRK